MEVDLRPITVVTVIVLVLSICGNMIVLYIQWGKLRPTKTYSNFVPYLGLSDLFAGIINTSFSIYEDENWNNLHDTILCKISWYMVSISQCLSGSLLLLIAAQRFIMCHPGLKNAAVIMKTF